MMRLDADIVTFDTPITPQPLPAVLKTIRFWINAFIPDPSLTPYVYPAPGASAGQSMIAVPGLNIPFARYFLGDNRTYSNSENTSARIHARVDIFDLDQFSPTMDPTHIYSGESIEINPTTGVIIARDHANVSRCHFLNLRANQSAGVMDSPSPNFVQLDFVAAANLPLLLGSPDIDMNGRLQIDRDAKTFTYTGKVDGFPCFEAYVSFNGGAPVNLFQIAPVAPFQLIGDANRPVNVTVDIQL